MRNADTLAGTVTAMTAFERGALIREEAVARGAKLREEAVARARALGEQTMTRVLTTRGGR